MAWVTAAMTALEELVAPATVSTATLWLATISSISRAMATSPSPAVSLCWASMDAIWFPSKYTLTVTSPLLPMAEPVYAS